MKIIDLDITLVKPYPNNPRKISDKAVDKVARSIKEFGWKQPIVVDKDYVIIVGHTRLLAAKKLELSVVPIMIADDLDDAKIKAYRLADNRTNEESEWDFDFLKTEFADLTEIDFDLSLTGFDDIEITNLLDDEDDTSEEEDDIPEVIESPVSCLGDIWILGKNRLMCGDSTSIYSVDKLMNGEKADMVFTDPPYGINENCDRVIASRNRKAKANSFSQIEGDENSDVAKSFCNLWIGFNIEKYVIWGANYFCHSLPESPQWLIWDKRESDNERNANSDCEMAWVKTGKKSARIFRHKWKGMIKASEQGQARVHPTQKPIALAEWCFNEYEAGDLIFDGFLGSGSTLIACERTNRKCYGMEIAPNYCDVIIKRWQNLTKLDAIHEESGKPFNDLLNNKNDG